MTETSEETTARSRPWIPALIAGGVVACLMIFWASTFMSRESQRDQAQEYVEALQNNDAVAEHAIESVRVGGSRTTLAVLWTPDRDSIDAIVADVGVMPGKLGVIVAEESAELGDNATSQECWIFDFEETPVAAGLENAIQYADRVSPSDGGLILSSDWCRSLGIWN